MLKLIAWINFYFNNSQKFLTISDFPCFVYLAGGTVHSHSTNGVTWSIGDKIQGRRILNSKHWCKQYRIWNTFIVFAAF